MNTRSITIAALTALLTAVTLGGSVWGFTFMMGPNSITRLQVIRSDNIIVFLIAVLTVFLCGGGLWGFGLASLMNADTKSLVKTCALTWGGTVFSFLLVVILLGNFFGTFSKINVLPVFPHYRQYNFLLIFVPAVGILTAINAYVATGKLGFKALKRSVGLCTGLVAALGFLVVGLILFFGLGWEVGYPHPTQYGMLLIFLICSISGAVAGGMAMGWMLEKSISRRDI
jgi:hypothetical protein